MQKLRVKREITTHSAHQIADNKFINCRNNTDIFYFFFIIILFFVELPLYAQRGKIEQVAPLLTPSDGFPGYFDTNVLPKNNVSLDVPTGALNYGATENLTLSLNLPLLFYAVESWTPTVLLSARYRFFSNKRLSSTLTGYGAYFGNKSSSEKISSYFLNATYNNSITLTSSQYLFTQVSAVKVYYKNTTLNSPEFEKKIVNAFAVALGHNFIFNERWSLQNIFAVPVFMNFHEESVNNSGIAEFNHIQNFPIFYRGLVSWKVSKKSLLSFGGFIVSQTDLGFYILPWFDWSFIF